jgi:hypothetical protein
VEKPGPPSIPRGDTGCPTCIACVSTQLIKPTAPTSPLLTISADHHPPGPRQASPAPAALPQPGCRLLCPGPGAGCSAPARVPAALPQPGAGCSAPAGRHGPSQSGVRAPCHSRVPCPQSGVCRSASARHPRAATPDGRPLGLDPSALVLRGAMVESAAWFLAGPDLRAVRRRRHGRAVPSAPRPCHRERLCAAWAALGRSAPAFAWPPGRATLTPTLASGPHRTAPPRSQPLPCPLLICSRGTKPEVGSCGATLSAALRAFS